MVIVQLLRNHMTVELRPEDRFCPNGMGFHLKIDTEQWKTERKMEFVKPLPVGAKRPSPSDSPYVNIR